MTDNLRLPPDQIGTDSSAEGSTLAVDDTDTVRFIESSVPVIILPAGSTSADVPAGTPVGTIVLVKA